jgi:hypothetical protein
MTAISVKILKINETSEIVKYAFGNPPARVLGHVIINKADGQIELSDIVDNKYKRYLLPAVLKQLHIHHKSGEYPEETFYNA